MRACRNVLVPGAMFCALLAIAPAQDIQEVRWGFDGRAVPGRFNVVSVYVHNPSAQPFDGTLELHKTESFGPRLDAPIEEPCHLSPGSGRWVQFYPFVTSTDDAWELACGRKRQQIPSVRAGLPALVLLEADEPGVPLADLPSFPAARFPPMGAATETLFSAVLDHVPAWDAARRTAFLDWLRGGGRLHLLQTFGGELHFTGDLAVLNDPRARFHVGHGVVVRHAHTRARFGAQQRTEASVVPLRSVDDTLPEPLQETLFERLRQVIAPRHNWVLIFLAGFLYLALVGPLHWALARRWNDYRWSNLALVGFVLLFCWIFLSLGARGHGEQQQVSTIGYARDLGGDAWNVTLYNNVFATSGDLYAIRHDAEHVLYSGAQQNERLRGLIQNGKQASFAVDIPLFSNRSFVCSGRFAHPSLRLVAQHWPATAATADVMAFSARIEGPFPEDVLAIHLMHRGQLWSARREGDELRGFGAAQSVDPALGIAGLRDNSQRYVSTRGGSPFLENGSDERAPGLRATARSLFETVLVERLTLLPPLWQRPDLEEADRIAVFVLAKAPDTFAVRCRGLEHNDSYVVFHADLIKEH